MASVGENLSTTQGSGSIPQNSIATTSFITNITNQNTKSSNGNLETTSIINHLNSITQQSTTSSNSNIFGNYLIINIGYSLKYEISIGIF